MATTTKPVRRLQVGQQEEVHCCTGIKASTEPKPTSVSLHLCSSCHHPLTNPCKPTYRNRNTCVVSNTFEGESPSKQTWANPKHAVCTQNEREIKLGACCVLFGVSFSLLLVLQRFPTPSCRKTTTLGFEVQGFRDLGLWFKFGA